MSTLSSVDEHRLLAEERPLQMRTHISPGPVVYADAESLARALANLLSNAIRLAPARSTLTTSGGSADGWAWIAVQDQGPGIARDEQQRIFDRFRCATNGDNGSRDRRGSGLGLAIARQIVESNEGRLALFSELGVGSTFVIWLPDRAMAERERSDEPPESPLLAR